VRSKNSDKLLKSAMEKCQKLPKGFLFDFDFKEGLKIVPNPKAPQMHPII